MANADVAVWAWTGTGPCPAPPAGALAAWAGPGGPAWGRDGPGPDGGALRAVVASGSGAAAAGAWGFAGRVRGTAVREYRTAVTAARAPEDGDPGLAPAAAFLCDRAAEVAATGAPWWTAWRQAAAALCETYEGCGFELAWTDGSVVLALVQAVALVLAADGTLTAGDGPGALARGRAELARLGLYAGGRCLAVAPVTGGA